MEAYCQTCIAYSSDSASHMPGWTGAGKYWLALLPSLVEQIQGCYVCATRQKKILHRATNAQYYVQMCKKNQLLALLELCPWITLGALQSPGSPSCTKWQWVPLLQSTAGLADLNRAALDQTVVDTPSTNASKRTSVKVRNNRMGFFMD